MSRSSYGSFVFFKGTMKYTPTSIIITGKINNCSSISFTSNIFAINCILFHGFKLRLYSEIQMHLLVVSIVITVITAIVVNIAIIVTWILIKKSLEYIVKKYFGLGFWIEFYSLNFKFWRKYLKNLDKVVWRNS